jgi:protein-L-isoaspartate(D-aspartate) O-methyltransferase
VAAAALVVTVAVYAAAVDYTRARAAMVAKLFQQGIRNGRILAAMGQVPRHEFVDPAYQARAYAETEIPIGCGEVMISPYATALMTETLNPHASAKVLLVGVGSGYQAALLAELGCQVFLVEKQPELAKAARRRLGNLGYQRVRFGCGDGSKGWSRYATYNAILVTGAVEQAPAPLVEQLAEGGRLVVPIGRGPEQTLDRMRKRKGRLRVEAVIPFRLSASITQPRTR